MMMWLRLLLVMWSFVSRFCLCLTTMTRIVWFFFVVVFACSHSLSIFFFVMSDSDGICENAERWMKHFLLLLSHFVGLSVRKCQAEVFFWHFKERFVSLAGGLSV